MPITSWLGFDAYGKTAIRKNGLDRGTAYFADDNGRQLYPFLKDMVDVRAGASATSRRPIAVCAGSSVTIAWS